ncbi:MAG: CapA family protein [Candidatus Cloacimonetes bacterium]|nr:CapA family protein [Candidatus Cloacimonadota bacterium]
MNDKKILFILLILILILCFADSSSGIEIKDLRHLNNPPREWIIENFDDGEIELLSYPGEDEEPDAWCLDSTITYSDSLYSSIYSLKLYGNTWKIEMIQPIEIDSGDVWQVSAYIQDLGEIHGFGVMDSENVLLYSLAGTQELNIEEWVTVYQGNFPEEQWNIYQLPIADDWFAWFDYLPVITGIVFVNDKDDTTDGTTYFDYVINLTDLLPIPPQVEINYIIGSVSTNSQAEECVTIQFFGEVHDYHSGEHLYFWHFGDDSTSTLQNPSHTYLVEDDHIYTVLLEVINNNTGLWGQATCEIKVEPGSTTFPVTMNFVGDIMLARGYEQPGGIIPTQGVEAIFEPTLSILGEAADITVVNLECPLTTHTEHHPTKTIYFKGSPENVAGLVYAGIDVITLANNHILDYMLPGIQETQSVLTENGIVFSGAGANSYEAYLPAFYLKSGVNIAFLASSDRTGQYNNYQPYLNAGYNKPGFAYMTPYYITQQIDAVKDYADLIVVEMHAGSEYSTGPGSNYDSPWIDIDTPEDEDYSPRLDIPHMWDIEIRHHTIDAGADLVICHHPHIIQGFEVYNGKLIANSLGNFAFDLSYAETFPSMILNSKIDETGFYEYSVTPVYIDDWIPVRAQGELGTYILDYLARHSKELNTYLNVDRENVIAEIIMDTLAMEITTESYEALLILEESNGEWISNPMRLQREGSISSINSITPTNNWEYRPGREIIWFGNFEDEGCSLWNVNSNDEWYDTTEVYQGNRSLCHRRFPNSGDNIITNFENRIKCYSDTTNYSLYGYIKTQNGADVTIEIRYYYSRYSSYYLGTEDIGVWISGDSDWTFYYKDLTLPEGTRFFDIRLNSNCPEIGVALSWFDNVGIIEWSDWEQVSPFENIPSPNDYYYLQIKSDAQAMYAMVTYTETTYGESHLAAADNDYVIKPTNCKLYQNYPNPFNSSTTISFHLATKSHEEIQIRIYNIKGQLVRTFRIPNPESRIPNIVWDGKDENGNIVSSGIYFYQFRLDDKVIDTKKCLLLR